MPTTYRDADADLTRITREMREDGHPDLAEADVTIFLRLAFGEGGEPAIKVRGRRMAVQVKINPYEARCQGLKDATITVDGDWWRDATEKERRAAVDSALMRIQVVRGETGEIKVDDANRPKLRQRVPDLFVEGFEVIVQKHGKNALEMKQLEDAWSRPAVQKEFAFG